MKRLRWLGMMICGGTLVVLTLAIGGRFLALHKEQRQFEQISNMVTEIRRETLECETEDGKEKVEMLPEYEKLAEENSDFAGWVRIEGTNIDYPVMCTPEDMEYYLHRDFYGNSAFSGTPFVGTGSFMEQDQLPVFVYGHNMRNGTMFSDLKKYQEEDFWQEHSIIELSSLYEKQRYKIFAVFYALEEDWTEPSGLLYSLIRGNPGKHQETMERIKKTSFYETGILPEKDGQLLFLVTCSYQDKNGRLVAAGVRIE